MAVGMVLKGQRLVMYLNGFLKLTFLVFRFQLENGCLLISFDFCLDVYQRKHSLSLSLVYRILTSLGIGIYIWLNLISVLSDFWLFCEKNLAIQVL